VSESHVLREGREFFREAVTKDGSSLGKMTKESIKKSLDDYKRREFKSTEFPGFRTAGVLVLLFPSQDELSVLLTVRTEEVESHKGQISLPGGVMDGRDRSVIETALRESSEEIGLKGDSVEILGLLDDTAVPSQFIITPVVGYVESKPLAKPNEVEVAEVFDVPLAFFADDENGRREERELRGQKFSLWFYDYKGKAIWGATAGILRNLAKLQSMEH
jgi:8-oxo-dGTP pyrophosphatase MutT (NUDIX family)